jgi:hypothetical protein
VQIYSLTNNYHRRLELTGLSQERWDAKTVDMTTLRRPDGSGGPLSENERIDDIQFYIDPAAELLIDDIVLYDAAPADAVTGSNGDPTKSAGAMKFPSRIIFTGWFDTGKQGQEWPGTFEIVPHRPPRTWKAARAVADPETGEARLRVNLRGQRPVGHEANLFLRYSLTKAANLSVKLRDSRSSVEWTSRPVTPSETGWTQATIRLTIAGAPRKTLHADELVLSADRGATLLVDDVLLYEPAR